MPTKEVRAAREKRVVVFGLRDVRLDDGETFWGVS